MNIQGRCAIVSGGSVGIGKAIADILTQRGANVFLIARREDRLKTAIADLEKKASTSSQRFGYFSGDVSDHATVKEAIKTAEAECGPPLVLINSAGFSLPGYVEKLPISDIETEIWVNYMGTLYTTKEIVNGMIERREGWILNISSLAGLKGIFGYTGYCGAKFAVVGFSEALRSELRPYGIKVSVLCPPDVATERFLTDARPKPFEMEELSKTAKLMQPEDVAQVAVEGMERNKFIIIPGFSGKMMHTVGRFAPWLIDAYLNRVIDKARKKRGL